MSDDKPESDDPMERIHASQRASAKADAEARAELAKMQADSMRRILNNRFKSDAEIAKKRLDSWKKP